MHISSLPGEYEIGSFGAAAYRFVDLLAELGFDLWQVLPLCPTDEENSPYNSSHPNDFNPLFIDLPMMYQGGVITLAQLEGQKQDLGFRIQDLGECGVSKRRDAQGAVPYEAEGQPTSVGGDALIAPRATEDGRPYESTATKVDYSFKQKRMEFLESLNIDLQAEARLQWFKLKKYANDKGIEIIGDIPYYVSRFSDEVANNPHIFNLETQGGAPPDYFAKDGQAWSVPTYNWDAEGILDWWAARIAGELKKYDYLRIDHFRGLVEYWELPLSATNGLEGKWQNARPYAWLEAVAEKVDASRLIAEDLGAWSENLESFVQYCKIPNMKVLQFGFDGNPDNPHLPQQIAETCVYYSGTHDNDTLVGFCDSVFKNYPSVPLAKEYMQQIWNCRADKIMIQAQDLLFLDSEHRMNIPGQLNAWAFRLPPDYAENIDKSFFRNLNQRRKG